MLKLCNRMPTVRNQEKKEPASFTVMSESRRARVFSFSGNCGVIIKKGAGIWQWRIVSNGVKGHRKFYAGCKSASDGDKKVCIIMVIYSSLC